MKAVFYFKNAIKRVYYTQFFGKWNVNLITLLTLNVDFLKRNWEKTIA